MIGIAPGKDNGWSHLRVGELKSMLALAGGDLEQALVWVEWTQDFNASLFTPARQNYYRCLHNLLLLREEHDREPAQYMEAFSRMYGEETLQAALNAIEGKQPFYGLQPIDPSLANLPVHQSLLAAYEKLQQAKRQSNK